MPDIVIVSELENNAWPSEFSGAWANIMVSPLGNIVFSLYFNEINSEGTILEDNNYVDLPHAYISIRPEGDIYELYVTPPLRRKGIGAMLCAWTRTNFIDRGLIVKAPHGMTDDAKELYSYLSVRYNEPYENPLPLPIFNVYLDFGGFSMSDIEQQYKQGE